MKAEVAAVNQEKALVGAAVNQEKVLVGAFSVIVKTDCETDGSSTTLLIIDTRSFPLHTL